MKLVLIRHADPDYPNDTITGKGHRQAELLGERFSHIPVKSMYVSSMGRAQHTAEYIGRSKNMTWSTHDFLRELDGCYNGTHWAWDYRGSDLFQEHITLSTENWTEIVPYGSHMQPICSPY
jgi:broad specificity phosphatase PhoE